MSFYDDINQLFPLPEEEREPYFMISRKVIEYCSISPESKGYYAMFAADFIDWDDIPQHNRDEIYSVPNFDEVKE